ncbi:hypothetical protein [Methylobacterium sp. E-046]|uniref:hypothetical protein n=1 Tax=Methylobacterium sp. E-046 TaxID=2836576 RepID=UPI001FB9DCCD|nr:hypothetical protein [Methylobacterium sp. E-046]MCJ2097477.1 hypothetical protein [Methylobacterium sp. E-046]
MTVIHGDFRPWTAIITKRKTYLLPPDAIGVPVEDRLQDVPDCMKGMKFWQTEDGEVLARGAPMQSVVD